MFSPKISIITASFNSEKTISDCINSILNQSYDNIEYIVIDGGSTDKTVEIIKNYILLFKGKLKWISESDKGIYDAWNKGLKLVSGDWISFIGSDDIFFKDAVADYVNVINNDPDINFISSKVQIVNNNLNPLRIDGKPWSLQMRTHCCISHVGSFHHKSLFYQKGLFNTEYLIAGDYDFLLRCYDIIKPFYMPTLTVKMRIGGISDRHILKIAKETLKAKIENKIKSNFNCYIDYSLMIFKYNIRIFLNFLLISK